MSFSHPPRTLPFYRRRSLSSTHLNTAANSPPSMSPESTPFHLRHILVAALFFFVVSLSCILLFRDAGYSHFVTAYSFPRFLTVFPSPSNNSAAARNEYPLEKILKEAAMEDKTVILTTLNEAWAAPNSVIDLFLESFRIGVHTRRLLNHLIIIALDQKAFLRCQAIHTYCFLLVSEGDDFHEEAYFMTPRYLKMMWRRIDFLRLVLEMGYNFVFTDADIMWFRDPFPRFHHDADFQIACDHFTAYFGGLCEPSKDLNQVCTMHANCCYGMGSKIHDLRIMLQDWRHYLTLPPSLKRLSVVSWRVPQKCSLDSLEPNGSAERSADED
ncbi:uncharacterized protein At4g15970 isoform X2 [Lathyrus oleraceus]|uniref:uncharacterized protein At4g15970 isoform X2 n=1 Tax=Pisum sativum TaxID=3888 RepID=UPI0021CF7B6D|nr:uncharacterized protein At4g15970-like isoform X2 [Pisum sativum]